MDKKQEIYKLVDTCDNDEVLNETIELLKSRNKKEDWWNKLSEQQQKITTDSLQQSINGLTLSHEEVEIKYGANSQNKVDFDCG